MHSFRPNSFGFERLGSVKTLTGNHSSNSSKTPLLVAGAIPSVSAVKKSLPATPDCSLVIFSHSPDCRDVGGGMSLRTTILVITGISDRGTPGGRAGVVGPGGGLVGPGCDLGVDFAG